MKLFSKIFVLTVLVSAQNQPCMDLCGGTADACHELCNDSELWFEDAYELCHDICREGMCTCFRACGCPECCGYSENTLQDEIPLENDKVNASQFLKKRTNWN